MRDFPTKSGRRGRRTPWLFALLGSAWLGTLTACAPEPGPGDAVRQWLAEAQAAVEGRDRGALMDMIDARYVDARGNDKEAIGQMLRVLFIRNQSMVLASKVDQVELFDDSAASVRLTAGMAGTRGRFPGLDAEVWRLELDLEKNDSDWLLIAARWGRPGDKLR